MFRRSNNAQLDTNACWLKGRLQLLGTQAFVLQNAELPGHAPNDVREAVREHIPPEQEAFELVITTLKAIDDVGLPLKPEHRQQFQSGLPVLIVPLAFLELEERPQGRQKVERYEKQARDALYINVALCVERLRAIDAFEDRLNLSVAYRRGKVFLDLAKTPTLPNSGTVSDRESFFRNAFREGQSRELLSRFFQDTPAKVILKNAHDQARHRAEDRLAQINLRDMKSAEIVSLTTLLHIYRQAQDVLHAQHEMSEGVREGVEMSRSLHQTLANAKLDGPALDEFMDAAIIGDLNPSDVFKNVVSWKNAFEVGRRMGRLSRGQSVEFTREHIVALKSIFELASRTDIDGDDIDFRMAIRLTNEADRFKGHAFWIDAITSDLTLDIVLPAEP